MLKPKPEKPPHAGQPTPPDQFTPKEEEEEEEEEEGGKRRGKK